MATPLRVSGMAVTSLVCGVLGCIPFLTGLLAIIFGLVSLRIMRNPAIRGRGIAIAGLILGFANVVGWGFGAYVWWQATAPERGLTRQFITNISQGNTIAALSECTADITAEQLQAITWFNTGSVQSISIDGTDIAIDRGFRTGTVNCQIHFSNGQTVSGQIYMINRNGVWSVHRFEFQ
jgi:hypothetical protein